MYMYTFNATVSSSVNIIVRGWSSAHSRVFRYSRRRGLEAALEGGAQSASRACGSRPSSSREHIIGVVVSEITSEMRIATDSVTLNSRNSLPTMPPANMNGMKRRPATGSWRRR